MRNRLAVWAGKSALHLGRRLGYGGSSLPGVVGLTIQPSLLGTLARGLRRGTVLVTGTNGKTTTASFLAAILKEAGLDLVWNRAGANLIPGLASAFIEASAGGAVDAEIALLEVDEAAVGQAVRELTPLGVVVTNFSRDQLDRYGELDATVALVGKALAAMNERGFLALNADDPLVAWLGRARPGRVVFYGVEDPGCGTKTTSQTREQRQCLACGRPLAYDAFYYGHLGRYRCPGGDLDRPLPTVRAESVRLGGQDSSFRLTVSPRGEEQHRVEVALPLPGLYNVYNGLGALSAALELGIPLESAAGSLSRSQAAFGRMERIDVGGRGILLTLVKNPTGFNQVLRTILESDPPPGGRRFLMAINDKYADGTDVSWLWDVDFEALASPAAAVAGLVASGTRAWDMAVRLKYAGVRPALVSCVPQVSQALDEALALVPPGETLYVTPTYTAMLELRDTASRRGWTAPFWEQVTPRRTKRTARP